MSNAGLLVRNANGNILIDQDYINFALSAKGSVVTSADPATRPQPMQIASITIPGTSPILAIRAPSDTAIHIGRNNGNGTWTFHFRGQSVSNYNIDYWAFDVMSRAIDTGTFNGGLRVWRADGSLVFDSSGKPMRIVGVSTQNNPPSTPPTIGSADITDYERNSVYTPTPGKLVAAVQGAFCYAEYMWDQGSYGETPDSTQVEIGDGSGPQPGDLWRYMYLAGLNTVSRVDPNGQVVVGLRPFERFEGWYPIGQEQVANVYGNISHWFVDVTGY